jgi:hypothetical protein
MQRVRPWGSWPDGGVTPLGVGTEEPWLEDITAEDGRGIDMA